MAAALIRPLIEARIILAVMLLAITGVARATPADQNSTDHELIERGAYIATAAGCAACHTTEHGAAYAGGAALKTSFGNLYGPNITADPQHGIGAWSRADFERALRSGVAKDADVLYPAMPYTNYTLISDADLDALWAFIHSQLPVPHSAPENTLRFPFSFRPALSIWQSLYFHPGRFQPDPKRSAQFNRGAYLVKALGHCDACHTPRNMAQATTHEHELTGADVSGWYAPDISNAPTSPLRDWSEAELVRFFKTGERRDNTKAIGPMQEVVHASLSKLTDVDRSAMAVYLRENTSAVTPVAATSIDQARIAAGRQVYAEHCASCHQVDGRGQAGVVPALASNSIVKAREPDSIIMAILEGFKPQGTWGAMASFAATLNDQQIADVTNYIRVAWNNGAPPNATEWTIDRWRQLAAPPASSQTNALLCPILPKNTLAPALASGSVALHRSAGSDGELKTLIQKYRQARPRSSQADVVEALSAAYCRDIAADGLSRARADAAIARYAQRVATLTTPR